MKKALLILLAVIPFKAITAQCDNLIISEYIEGWSNNKAIEIYNASSSPIDMGPYELVRFQNQNQTPGNGVDLEGILMPYDVYVVVLDKRDSNGTGLEAPVWDELQIQADTFVNPLYNNGVEAMYFNGNDAVMLLNDAGTVIYDLFGKIGDLANPDGWGPYTNNLGETVFMSANHTLIRKQNIQTGVTLNPTAFDLTAEWDTLQANTFDQLGFHLCNCDPNVGIGEYEEEFEIQLFPNPLMESDLTLKSDLGFSTIQIYTITGQKVFELNDANNKKEIQIATALWEHGTYLVNLKLANGMVTSKRFIKK